MVLIQEMALKIDQGFLGALSELFTPSTDPEAERQRVMYERDRGTDFCFSATMSD